MITKKMILFMASITFFLSANAQITINTGAGSHALINDLLDTTGSTLNVTNVSLTCDSGAHGIFSGVSNLGLDNGIILGSGLAQNSITTFGSSHGHSLGLPGDSDLTVLSGNLTNDACVLEFDFTPFGDTLIYKYVFTSDEYPTFNCTNFNDVFAFYISGPGYIGKENVALLPNSTTQVSINTVNDGTGGNCGNTNFFVVNTDTIIKTQGFTIPLTVRAPVTNGQQYHLKLAIADASDDILNSYVFLGRKSLFCKPAKPNSVKSAYLDKDIVVYPTSFTNTLFVKDLSKKIIAFEVYTIEGKLAFNSNLKYRKEHFEIPLKELNNGIYIIKFMGEDNNSLGATRIIKK